MKTIMKLKNTPAGCHLVMQENGDYTLIAKYKTITKHRIRILGKNWETVDKIDEMFDTIKEARKFIKQIEKDEQYSNFTLIPQEITKYPFHEYVVCNGYDVKTGTWSNGHYYGDDLHGATEFLKCQDENYISRARLEEIATKVLHICKNDEEAMQEIDYEIDLQPHERGYFGLVEDEEEYTPSAENGDYSPTHPWDAPGMCMSDFI